MRYPKTLLEVVLLLTFISVHWAVVLPESYGSDGWTVRYNGPGNGYDGASALVVDAEGNVYVTGRSAGVGPGSDYTTIKYNPAGTALWTKRYNGPANDWDEARALGVDNEGNVYVTGESTGNGSGYDWSTVKYSSSGERLWAKRYNGPGNDWDTASALAVDSEGNVFVTGYSTGIGSGTDYTTVKYSSSGAVLWTKRYNGPGNSWDEACALAVDAQGNVYVTGYSAGAGSGTDYTTIKYSPSGAVLWAKRYNGPGNGNDDAHAIALDSQGNVYVTGESEGTGSSSDYATIKYSPTGERLWAMRYNGPGNGIDDASGLAVDSQGNVYVTGNSQGAKSAGDYATIKYSQYE